MSADSTKVIPIFGYFQEKRFQKALEHLCFAYDAHLEAEQEVLEALVQIGWNEWNEGNDDSMTREEMTYCFSLARQAKVLKQSGKHVREIMRDIAGGEVYSEGEESSED